MSGELCTQFDIPLMHEVYQTHPNYEIANLNPKSKRCIIFFSSNGLYSPNSLNTFRREVVEKNRFEWRRNIPASIGKAIFVRDVAKQWYLEGINRSIDSVVKLKDFLQKETEGYQVSCIGSSAGGYAASLLGALLKAEQIFCFSAQFSLESILENPKQRARNPTLVKYENDALVKQYYRIDNILRDSQVPVFYFYPAMAESDKKQSLYVKNLSNVYSFAFKQSVHGRTCYLVNLPSLLNRSVDDMLGLHQELGNKLISPFLFSLKISGLEKTLKYCWYDHPRIVLKKGRKYLIERFS